MINFKDWVKVIAIYDIIEIQVHHLSPLPLVVCLHYLHLYVPSTHLRHPPYPPQLLLHPCQPCPLNQPWPSCSSSRVQRPILCSHKVNIFSIPNFLIGLKHQQYGCAAHCKLLLYRPNSGQLACSRTQSSSGDVKKLYW